MSYYTDTFIVNIYCGLKESYNGHMHKFAEAEVLLQKYCDEESYGLTLSETKFIYHKGNESGIVVGLINYPRYPSPFSVIKERAIKIATILKEKFKQELVSIVMSDETIMLGKE